MTYVRWFGVVFAAVSIPIQPSYPDALTRQLAWVVTGLLAFGSVAIWGALARINTEANLQKLGAVAFALDCFIVMSFVWLFAYQDPYVT